MHKRVCIVGASGKLGRYMVRHALDRGHAVPRWSAELALAALLVALATPGRPAKAAVPGDSARWTLNDTGQHDCYDERHAIRCPRAGEAFHGQDAQHGPNRMRLRRDPDGTVTDLVTGLVWTAAFVGPVPWDEAVGGAARVTTGGFSDWRLPNIKELYSIVDFSGVFAATPEESRPFLDATVFEFEYGAGGEGPGSNVGPSPEGMPGPGPGGDPHGAPPAGSPPPGPHGAHGERPPPPGPDPRGGPPGGEGGPGANRFIDAQYWSATRYRGTTMGGDSSVFGVNFADGRLKAYPHRFRDGRRGHAYARYVRGGHGYGANRFDDGPGGTVRDVATGLVWAKEPSASPLDWKHALAYADTLTLGGHDDWRLPNAKELQSIVDYEAAPAEGGAIHALPAIFGKGESACYWTSTTVLEGPSHLRGSAAAYVAFEPAMGWMAIPPRSLNFQLLDVHGAGAQRVDLKSGDPARFPRGRGPQGDVVRIRNFVRCVRN